MKVTVLIMGYGYVNASVQRLCIYLYVLLQLLSYFGVAGEERTHHYHSQAMNYLDVSSEIIDGMLSGQPRRLIQLFVHPVRASGKKVVWCYAPAFLVCLRRHYYHGNASSYRANHTAAAKSVNRLREIFNRRHTMPRLHSNVA